MIGAIAKTAGSELCMEKPSMRALVIGDSENWDLYGVDWLILT